MPKELSSLQISKPEDFMMGLKIGFIGLGIMDKPMSKNLIKTGHELTVYDVVEAPVRELEKAGAKVAHSSKEVAEKSDLVITMSGYRTFPTELYSFLPLS